MTQIQSRFLILLPYLAITMLPALVAAQTSLGTGDEKILPGAMCQPSDQTAKYRREPSGIMYNFDDFAQEWVCPILRDNEHARSSALKAAIEVVIQNEEDEVSCTLCSFSWVGGVVLCVDNRNTTKPLTEIHELVWKNNPNIPSKSSGYYFIQCTIPGPSSRTRFTSGVIAYRWAE